MEYEERSCSEQARANLQLLKLFVEQMILHNLLKGYINWKCYKLLQMKNLNHPLYMNKVWVSTKADKGGTLKEDLKNLCYFGINVVTNGDEIEIKESFWWKTISVCAAWSCHISFGLQQLRKKHLDGSAHSAEQCDIAWRDVPTMISNYHKNTVLSKGNLKKMGKNNQKKSCYISPEEIIKFRSIFNAHLNGLSSLISKYHGGQCQWAWWYAVQLHSAWRERSRWRWWCWWRVRRMKKQRMRMRMKG